MGKISEKIKDNIAGVESEPGGEKWLRVVLPVLTLTLIINVVVGIWWSQEPETFVVQKSPTAKIGETTVSTLARVVETLRKKPGGYLSNDYMLPSIILDNMPAWEFGVVVQVRDISRVLRKDISRSQSQSTEDASLALAEPKFNLNAHELYAAGF